MYNNAVFWQALGLIPCGITSAAAAPAPALKAKAKQKSDYLPRPSNVGKVYALKSYTHDMTNLDRQQQKGRRRRRLSGLLCSTFLGRGHHDLRRAQHRRSGHERYGT